MRGLLGLNDRALERASSAACPSRRKAMAATTTATPSVSWFAGGGFKAGYVHGRTDDFSYATVEGKMSCPDSLATILQQLGLDHNRLKYLHHGRAESLTDSPGTHARVVPELIS